MIAIGSSIGTFCLFSGPGRMMCGDRLLLLSRHLSSAGHSFANIFGSSSLPPQELVSLSDRDQPWPKEAQPLCWLRSY